MPESGTGCRAGIGRTSDEQEAGKGDLQPGWNRAADGQYGRQKGPPAPGAGVKGSLWRLRYAALAGVQWMEQATERR